MSSLVATHPRWRRLEPDARREQILECAIELFGERPYADVSTSDIARRVGVARGLLHHYFGSKRDLYLEVVRRMVRLPPVENAVPATGSLQQRVDQSVKWYLDTVGAHGKTYAAVTGPGGIGDDPEVERIIRAADNVAATKVLRLAGLQADVGSDKPQRAAIRAYGGLVKATIREWAREGTLTREQAHLICSNALLCIVREVLPRLRGNGT
ncbi:MAG TPA: helix-turn-helix domain-containing protein, partial [Labilithrix sp.]|nr:helix-turn-helix domain-containing protein [Labilithrix sp.]